MLAAYHDEAGDKVNVISISLDDDVSALERYFSKERPGLPVYHGTNDLARKFKAEVIPTLLIFDAQGKLVFNKAGVYPVDMLKQMAEKYGK